MSEEEHEGRAKVTYVEPELEVFTGAAVGAGILAVLGFVLFEPAGAIGGGLGAALGAEAAEQRRARARSQVS